MTASFNLSTEPWVPCELLDGTRLELSTHDALVRAHEIRAIVDASPLVVGVLHRHLLAVAHRVVDGPRDLAHWQVTARAGKFDSVAVERYINTVRDRLDLFDRERPFAQVSGLKSRFNIDPIDQLTIERSSWGTARALFRHRHQNYVASMSYPEAARGLLVHHAFATGGLVKKPGEPISATAAPLVRSALVVLRHEDLFKTLMANMLIYSPSEAKPFTGVGGDAPSWELDPQPAHLLLSDEPKALPRGWLHMLTWLSRRLELVERDGRVVGYVRAVGQGNHEQTPRDPMVAYRRHEKLGMMAIGMNPDRAMWRNAHALFQVAKDDNDAFLKPQTMAHAASPKVRAVLGERVLYSIDMYGIAAEKSRIDLVRAEHLHAMASVMDDPDAAEHVRAAVDYAELAVQKLNAALLDYARHALSAGSRDPDVASKRALVESLGAIPGAWSDLSVHFDAFLRGLADDGVAARDRFAQRCVDVVKVRWHSATNAGEASAGWLKARALSESSLRRGIASLLTSMPRSEVDVSPTEEQVQ